MLGAGWGMGSGLAQTSAEPDFPALPQSTAGDASAYAHRTVSKMRNTTAAQRKAAAARANAARASLASRMGASAAPTCPVIVFGMVPDYLGGCYPNYANSPILRKFVDPLPGLGPDPLHPSAPYIPIAVKDTTTYPGSDYYQISVNDYTQKLHSDLPATRLRGYKDLAPTADGANHYLGPFIIASKGTPVRIKFINNLATGAAGNLFLPVDTTVMGAGMGPSGGNYTQNRAELHLHGGNTPWISDGTPHQWITPAGESTSYKKGVSFQNVPDMVGPGKSIPIPSAGDGAATYYYPNQQSSRLMWYHDHSYGLTRLNVYAGEVSGYLLTDNVEEQLISTQKVIPDLGGNYHWGVPLVIQDKTFVSDPATLAAQDPTWDTVHWGGQGSLWFPHVYMPNQNPADDSGAAPMGRWDYGPWFWPPQTTLTHPAQANPYPQFGAIIPGTPNPSIVPEGFMDTPLINGAAYPYLQVEAKAYRFRILNGSNDRYFNVQLYYALDSVAGTVCNGSSAATCTEVKMVDSVPHKLVPPVTTPPTLPLCAPNAVPNPTTGLPAGCWPATWPSDGRDGGVPDPATAGPALIQIGTEGGFLPAPVVIPSQPVGYNYNRRDIVVLNISDKALFLGPAERADIIVDFSNVLPGSTLILYNDAPAPVPAFDARNDYYTGDPDQRPTGGANTTLAGYGPNTRTMMQFRVVAPTGTPAPFSLAALQTAFASTAGGAGAYKASQPPPLVPEKAYDSALNTTTLANTYSRIQSTSLTWVPAGTTTPTTMQIQSKALQELFDADYGRMNSTLGVELPFTSFLTQTTIPLAYIDPPTETIKDNETQIWKITHNGVDTHALHFHLFNVQLINRVGWDGAIRPPDDNELGWKEVVRMNPLEDAIVALQPLKQTLPWPVPDSVRLLDPTSPQGSTAGFTGVNPATNQPITVTNLPTNFAWEYVWHCHLLGHEENDMMRPIVFQVPHPVAVTQLVATPGASLAVNLSWSYNQAANGSAPATGFQILRSSGTGVYAMIASVSATARTYSDTSITGAGTYNYQIVAFNPAAALPSNTATIVITQGPVAPTNLVGTLTAPAQVNLSWSYNQSANGNTPATGFQIQRATGAGAFATIKTVSSSARSYTDTTAPTGATYSYQVIAYNALLSLPSNVVTIAIPTPQIPAAPSNLAVTLVIPGGTDSVVLTWVDTNTAGATGFSVWRSSNSGSSWTQVGTASVTTFTYMDTGLSKGRTYLYRVQATGSGGANSPYSNTITVLAP